MNVNYVEKKRHIFVSAMHVAEHRLKTAKEYRKTIKRIRDVGCVMIALFNDKFSGSIAVVKGLMMHQNNIPDDIDMTDGGYEFQPAADEMKQDIICPDCGTTNNAHHSAACVDKRALLKTKITKEIMASCQVCVARPCKWFGFVGDCPMHKKPANAEIKRDVELQPDRPGDTQAYIRSLETVIALQAKEIERLKDGLRQMVSNTAIYGENAGELAAQLLR